MNEITILIEELRKLIATSELSADERFQVAINRMAGFLAETFSVGKDEVAVLWKHKRSLSFLWPDFLAAAKELPVGSKRPIAAKILRSGDSFLDNRLIDHEHMVEYEFVKEPDGGSRLIWKMMGVAVTVEGKRLGVVQISRKRSAYNEPGPDFTPADLDELEKLAARLGPFLLALIPY
jgi:hypothetical protein